MKCDQGTKLIAITEKHGRLIGVLICSASCLEVGIVEPTLDACFVGENPTVLIGDIAYDLNPLDTLLWGRCIEMIIPHKKNRKRAVTQDGRRLSRY